MHALDPFLLWLESTAFSTWMRESPSVFAFPAVLSIHTIGMALIVGIGVALDLRILGVGRDVPIGEMKKFFVPMWVGFWLNVVSGIALLIAYPTKALTNPVFYTKLTLIAIAIVLFQAMRRRLFQRGEALVAPLPARLRALAAASLVCWASAITAGRLLAYTYTRLLATF